MSNGSSSPEAAVSPRDELRWKLAAIASQHGIALVSRRDHWDTCERALRDAYSDRAREIHAAVAALRCGIVADLVAWRADGAMRVERELTQRFVERTTTDPELARWAIDAWAFAFKIPLDGEVTEPEQEWAGETRDVIIRARHLVLLGAVAGLAVAATVMSAGVARFSGAAADSATAAPAPKRVPQSMARRGPSGNTGNRDRSRDATEPARPRESTRLAEGGGGGAQKHEAERKPTTPRSDEVSLGDIVARMPKQSHAPVTKLDKPGLAKAPTPARVAQAKPAPKKKEIETIRGAFAVASRDAGLDARTQRARRLEDRAAKSSGATVQAGLPNDESPACAGRRPRLIRNYEPQFPTELQDKGVSGGRVVLRFRVDDDGSPDVGSARVLESSHPSLVQSALEALEHLRYEPAPEGCSEAVTIERTIRFF